MEQQVDPVKLQKVLTEMANRQQELAQKESQRQARELADKIVDVQTAILSAGFDKAATYTNLIVLGGYATYFALWSQVKDHLTPIAEILSGLCMLVSALTFVLFEVYKMVYVGRTFHRQRGILIDDSIKNNPQAILSRLEEHQRETQRQTVIFGKVWLWNVGIAVTFALLATSFLLYGMVRGLIVSYLE